MQDALRVQGLEKSFKEGFLLKQKKVLNAISFSVAQGATTGFVGINGSGKTTSIKSILGFLFPEKGEIHFFGNKPLSNEVKKRIGYLPERPYYYEFLTAEEFLRYHWQLAGAGSGFQQACSEVLEKVNLSQARHRRLRSFSKGMLQRAGMAQALLTKPDFLILDEPMSGLDPDGRILIKEIIKQEQKRGTTIFFSSHLLGDMEELCRDVIVIDQGEVLYQGAMIQLALQFEVEFKVAYVGAAREKIEECLCSKADLQKTIDQLRTKGFDVIRISPAQLGIELAFTHLRKTKQSAEVP